MEVADNKVYSKSDLNINKSLLNDTGLVESVRTFMSKEAEISDLQLYLDGSVTKAPSCIRPVNKFNPSFSETKNGDDKELQDLATLDIQRLNNEIDEMNDEIIPKLLPVEAEQKMDAVLEARFVVSTRRTHKRVFSFV